jgi:uroporphyrinogen-III synthase
LREAGFAVLNAPLSRIVPSGAPCPAGPFDALAVTSAAALPALIAARLPFDLPLFTVGGRSASAARKAGFRHVVAGPGDARGLAAILACEMKPGARVLMVLARDHKPHLPDGLAQAGIAAVPWIAYGAEPVPSLPAPLMQALSHGTLSHALHYSRRSAAILRDLARAAGCEADLKQLRHLCLSADVAGALDGFDIAIAEQPEEEALLALLPAAVAPKDVPSAP